MKNKSCLRYPGGKTRACAALTTIFNNFVLPKLKISPISPSNEDVIILSPFFGGGSFEFHLQNEYGFEIVACDKFKPLYTFWNTCKLDNVCLCEKLRESISSGITKEQFSALRIEIKEMSATDASSSSSVLIARNYFIINRCSFSGATLSGGFSKESSNKRFTASSIDRVEKLDLSSFSICNEDFEDFLNKYLHASVVVAADVGKKIFIFLDPPYYLKGGKSKLYGNNGDMHENFDHVRLYNFLHSSLPKHIVWMMTYNKCDFIENMYSHSPSLYTIIDVDWSYGMNKTKTSSEIVILGGGG